MAEAGRRCPYPSHKWDGNELVEWEIWGSFVGETAPIGGTPNGIKSEENMCLVCHQPQQQGDVYKYMNIFDRISRIGVVANDDENTIHQKQFLVYEGILMSAGGLMWGTIVVFLNRKMQSAIPYGYIVLTFFNLFYFAKSKNFPFVRDFQTTISLLLPFAFQCVLGGFTASGGVMLWAMLAVAASLSYQNVKSSLLWLVLYLILTIITGIFDSVFIDWIKPNTPLSISVMLYMVNIVVISSIIFALLIFYVLRNNTFIQLKKTQEQLVKAEKMAAFGIASRRMAHEILNPINFINNFSDISQGLIADLLTHNTEEEKKETAEVLVANLIKINQHGKRAEAIVKQLQEHTNKGTAQDFFEAGE
ncbi:MAG: hypothetical protein NTX03_12500 [Bacteroidetes bacterium]|nr:hypothetical protein [Bacteroidota bacterium]